MRDIIVILVFSFGALAALRRPYYGALLWVWIGVMNPHRLGWGFAYSLPFAVAAAAVTMLGMAMHPKQIKWKSGPAITLLLIFVAWMGVTSFNAIHVDGSLTYYVKVLKVMFMTIVIAMLVNTREEVLGLLTVGVGSVAFYGVKGGFFTIMTGGAYRVWGPPSSEIEGNNELAVALIMVIPLIYFLMTQVPQLRMHRLLRKVPESLVRRGLLLFMGLCGAAAVGSQSRGALLAVVAMGGMFWWRSKAKVSIGFALAICAVGLLMFMPESWFERMHTISTYQQDASAMGRINSWHLAINVAGDRLLGAGFVTTTPDIFERYAPNPNIILVAHSIYFQILGQHGYIGLALYLLFWIATYRTGGRLVKLSRNHPELAWAGTLGSLSKVSLVGFAVGGAFLSLAYWDFPYYLMVALVCSEWAVKRQLAVVPQSVPDAEVTAAPLGVERTV